MKKEVENYEGRQFASITEMCEFHNIARSTYLRRVSRGWSKEKALTTSAREIDNSGMISEKERHKKYNKFYYAKHKVRENERLEKYRESHREELHAKDKIYRDNNKDRNNVYQKSYRDDESNKEKAKAYQKAYREKKCEEKKGDKS